MIGSSRQPVDPDRRWTVDRIGDGHDGSPEVRHGSLQYETYERVVRPHFYPFDVPVLTQADLYRKSTVDKRQLGDTRRLDGKLWEHQFTVGGPAQEPSSGSRPYQSPVLDGSPLWKVDSHDPGETSDNRDADRPVVGEGKLWNPVIGLSESECDEWEREGYLQFFCHSEWSLIYFLI